MIHKFGLWSPFLLDAVSYVGVLVALMAMRIDELHAQRKAEREPGLVRAGLRYVWGSQALRVPLIVMLLVYLFTFNFSVVIPLHAYRTYEGSAMEIGWFYAALGLGAFLGAIAMANRQTRANVAAIGGVLGGVRRLPRRRGAGSDVRAGRWSRWCRWATCRCCSRSRRTQRCNGSPVRTCVGG